MMALYPPITPYSTGFLQVAPEHQIYWEQLGNPDGVPVVFLHGGPGGGASLIHRQYFDPNHYRIIIFDQRGSGRSHPLGSLDQNTPADLVNDLEALRAHLRVERWHLFGGSWGSTLGLLYAATYPMRCLGLVLHGIFLMEPEEIEWFTTHIGRIFPEAQRAWLNHLDPNDRAKPLPAYERLLTTGAMITQVDAAKAWCAYDIACSALDHDPFGSRDPVDPKLFWAWARIECHYFRHHLLSDDEALLKRVQTAAHIPLIIIQGRNDMMCPVRSADALHRVWTSSELVIVPNGGHSTLDGNMQKQLIDATNRMRYLRPS